MTESPSAENPTLKGLDRPGRRATMQLEGGLRGWESLCLWREAILRPALAGKDHNIASTILSGPMANWRSIRAFLKRVGNPNSDIQDIENFLVSDEQRQTEREFSMDLAKKRGAALKGDEDTVLKGYDNFFIPQLVSWARESRRVFSLDKQSSDLFKRISYGTFTWDQVLRPFKSFMIELQNSSIEQKDRHGRTVKIDGILVTDLTSIEPRLPPQIQFRLFVTEVSRPVGMASMFSSDERKLAEKYVGGDTTLRQEFNAMANRKVRDNAFYTNYGDPITIRLDEPILKPELNEFTNEMRKIIAGLCLYLAHAPGKEVGVEDIRGETWHPASDKPKKPSKKLTPEGVISDEAQVLSVRNVHEFDPTRGRIVFTDQKGAKQEAQAVRAHERRRKGEGHLPDAPTPVKVASYWRYLQELSDDALPPGSTTVVR